MITPSVSPRLACRWWPAEPADAPSPRLDAPTCGGIVHFPAIGLKTILPPGQVTLVEFTLPTSGELSFTCGAGIMHGAVVIRSLELCSWFLG